jgi:hypothetical protein
MATFIGFAGQNWLITPAVPIPFEGLQPPVLAEPVRQPVAQGVAIGGGPVKPAAPDPTVISQLQWLLVLSGIALFSPGDSLNPSGNFDDVEIATISPDIISPMTYAINQAGLAVPQGQNPVFSVEQYAPFCTSLVAHSAPSGEGGWVQVWRPTPFLTGTTLPQVFTGINAQVAVLSSGSQATIRISYTFTLLGRIFFMPVPIIE